MCELFAISSRLPATVSLSLKTLAEHGGGSAPHADGWVGWTGWTAPGSALVSAVQPGYRGVLKVGHVGLGHRPIKRIPFSHAM